MPCHLSWSVNSGGPCGTGVSVLGPLLLPHVQWSRVLSLVLLPGFLLQSAAPPNGNTRTCPRHGAVKDTRHPFLLRPRAQHEAGSGDSSEVHAEGGLSRSVPGESRPSLGSSRARAAQRAARRAASEGVRAAAGRRAGPSHGRGPSCTGQAEGGEQQPWRTESGWRALSRRPGPTKLPL